jgi:transcriptional regulator with XRE-family HTH domain
MDSARLEVPDLARRRAALGLRSPRDSSAVGVVLAAFMRDRGLTQAQLADKLGLDRTYVSKILSGSRQLRDVGRLRQVAHTIGVPPERFGLLPEQEETVFTPEQDRVLARVVREDVDAWRKVRMTLNYRRSQLTKVAASLYDGVELISGTPLMTAPGWMPTEPVNLGELGLTWTGDSPTPAVTGGEAESERCRPLKPHGGHYPRYSNAIRDLDPPTLFENRVSYRLLDLVSNRDHHEQTYGYTTYFAMVDVCEVVAHEIAAAWLRHDGNPDRIRSSELLFRTLIDDPFDLSRRPVLPSTDTLTIRHDMRTGRSSLLLHRRNPDKVALAGGMTHVIPAGVFQPSGIAPENVRADFDLWHNILRELSEEFLGNPEHDGSRGEAIDYDAEEPFASLNAARTSGQVRVWYLGTGLDPLTLAGEILTVLVIDADVFDDVFADVVAWNSEGDVVFSADGSVGVPWRRDSVYQLLATEPLAPAAQACIELAWDHQDLLLGQHR